MLSVQKQVTLAKLDLNGLAKLGLMDSKCNNEQA